MSVEHSDLEQFSEIIAATRALLLSERSRGVHYLPVTPPDQLAAALEEPKAVSQPEKRRQARAPEQTLETRKQAKAVTSKLYGDLSPALLEVYNEAKECVQCPLSEGRKQVVFGIGANDADLMIIGESPGAIEDVRGEPFVGPIGDMLNKMLVNVVGLSRTQVYLVNAVKCKVKGGKSANIDEITQCKGHLKRQIKAVSPKLILCLGEAAAQSVVQSSKSVEELRGSWYDFEEIPVLVSFNPAFLLKNPKFKRPVFNDLKLLAAKYDELGGAR
mgnify:CR=1 FL=1